MSTLSLLLLVSRKTTLLLTPDSLQLVTLFILGFHWCAVLYVQVTRNTRPELEVRRARVSNLRTILATGGGTTYTAYAVPYRYQYGFSKRGRVEIGPTSQDNITSKSNTIARCRVQMRKSQIYSDDDKFFPPSVQFLFAFSFQ